MNPDYNLELYEEGEITEGGLLICGKLRPKTFSLPEFWIRWNERADGLDVDIYGEGIKREEWRSSLN